MVFIRASLVCSTTGAVRWRAETQVHLHLHLRYVIIVVIASTLAMVYGGVWCIMKIITININKGGTGKSTVSYNLAKWLAEEQNKKVLLVDGDRSCNLSFSLIKEDSSNIVDIFKNKEVKIIPINENLDFISGSEKLEDDNLNLKSKQNNCMIFFMWVFDNIENLNKYDYLIIDTHNDTSLVTSNFLAVSDMVLGVAEPSRNGYRAWLELLNTVDYLKKELIDIKTRETYVNTHAYLVANKVDHIGNSSRQFLEIAQKDTDYIGMIQKKELLAKTLLEDKSIFEMKKNMSEKEKMKHKQFFENIECLFHSIIEK